MSPCPHPPQPDDPPSPTPPDAHLPKKAYALAVLAAHIGQTRLRGQFAYLQAKHAGDGQSLGM